LEGINKDDFVVIWGGGIYNWFDPLSLIKAMSIVYEKRKDIKLFFMGIKHPNPLVKELGLVNETVELAKSLGIYEKNVFFNFGWVPYEERQNYLLESDVGIITHPVHIETRFSFRTRVLDYIWANIPIISTEGDFFSEIIKEKELGLVVKEKDPEDIANAILKLAEDKDYYKKCVKNLSEIYKDYTWENVCKPLIKYCIDPLRSAAKGNSSLINEQEDLNEYSKLKNIKVGNKNYKKSPLIKKFFTHLFKSGPQKTFKYTLNYLKGK